MNVRIVVPAAYSKSLIDVKFDDVSVYVEPSGALTIRKAEQLGVPTSEFVFTQAIAGYAPGQWLVWHERRENT